MKGRRRMGGGGRRILGQPRMAGLSLPPGGVIKLCLPGLKVACDH